MRLTFFPQSVAGCLVATVLVSLLTGCGSTRPLPKYERPLAHTTFQTVRATAYTHTEADHLEYSNRNALGGTLHAAGPAVVPAAAPVVTAGGTGAEGGFYHASNPVEAAPGATGSVASTTCGSAAADWSRWPVGTIFRLLPTGQIYKVDDYGWALAGRNTIDLYMPTRAAMNAWGVRSQPIEVLQWGDRRESLRLLDRHQKYRHIRRMVLELEGRNRAAASLH